MKIDTVSALDDLEASGRINDKQRTEKQSTDVDHAIHLCERIAEVEVAIY